MVQDVYDKQAHSGINMISLVNIVAFERHVHAACSYIYRKPTGGIHEYLCNRLFELSDDSVDRVLSQLCELAIGGQHPSACLQRTLVGLASRSTRNALKVCCRCVNQSMHTRALGHSCRPHPFMVHASWARCSSGSRCANQPSSSKTGSHFADLLAVAHHGT